ncbi:hypothetical protein P7C71_g5173, partial [Lecanoromycetidae sp. Uapishka_2]
MDPILDGLNAAQHIAVTSPSPILQVLAPPGSGKTKTLTSRVAYLLQHYHYKPWNVICLTFTIKSSREMKERISKLIGNGIESKLVLGTFHSVCRRYLVSYGHKIGIPKSFGIADSSDTLSIIKRIIKRLGINADPRKAQSRISSSKSRGISHVELVQQNSVKKNIDLQEFIMVFGAYESQLARSNLLDYDDLLLRTVDLLRQHPSCVSNVEAVLIDEFQDTNLVQFDLMRLFAARNKRVTTVGDPDQSIYGWRSAEIKNLKKMQKQYPDTLSPEDLLRHIIKKLDFQVYIEKHYADDHETRWANVQELVAQAAEFQIRDDENAVKVQDDQLPHIEGLQQEQGNAAEEVLSKFLANVALATELQREDEDTNGEAAIIEASKDLQSYEDSLWPQNGEENAKAIANRWSRWEDNSCKEHPPKRQRVKEDFHSTVMLASSQRPHNSNTLLKRKQGVQYQRRSSANRSENIVRRILGL